MSDCAVNRHFPKSLLALGLLGFLVFLGPYHHILLDVCFSTWNLIKAYEILAIVAFTVLSTVVLLHKRVVHRWPWVTAFAVGLLGLFEASKLTAWYGFSSLTAEHSGIPFGSYVDSLLFIGLIPVLAAAYHRLALEQLLRFLLVSLALFQVMATPLQRFQLLPRLSFQTQMIQDAMGAFETFRAHGFLGPILLGGLLNLSWPLLFFRHPAVFRLNRRAYGFALFGSSAIVACALLTYARSSLAGVFLQLVTCAVLWRWGRRPYRHLMGVAAAMVIAVFLITSLSSATLTRRITAPVLGIDTSILNRLSYLSFAVQMIAERPLSGWGPAIYKPFFRAFGAIPNVGYYPWDAHSSILNWLVTNGIAGVALIVCALLYPDPRRAIALLPPAYVVSMVGVLPLLLGDNVTSALGGFSFTFCLGASVWQARQRCSLIPERPVAAIRFAPGLLFGLYLVGLSLPPPDAGEWFERVMRRAAQRVTGHICFVVQSLGETFALEHEPDRQHPSVLASLGILADSFRATPAELIPVPGFRICEACETTRPLEIPARDLIAAAVSNPMGLGGQWLRQAAYQRNLEQSCRRWLGHADFGQATLPSDEEFCVPCARVIGARPADDTKLVLTIEPTTCTTRQLTNLWRELAHTDSALGESIKAGMRHNPDELGFIRHLPRGPYLLHCSFYSGPTREEVLIVNATDRPRWMIAACYTCSFLRGIVPRPDNAANRQFAELAFRAHSFFATFDPVNLSRRKAGKARPFLWMIERREYPLETAGRKKMANEFTVLPHLGHCDNSAANKANAGGA